MHATSNPPLTPPGPRGLPLVGSLLEFRRDPTGFLAALATDYGDIAHFKLGRQSAFQLNHPDYIREALVEKSARFVKTRVLERAASVIGQGLLSSNGDFHRRQRRIVQPAFQRRRIAEFGSAISRCAAATSQRWRDGASVDMFSEMLRLSLAIVGETLFGSDIEAQAEDVKQAMTVVFEHFNHLMVPFAGITDALFPARRARFLQARATLEQLVNRMIAERRAQGVDRGDMLSSLLFTADDETGAKMSDAQVRDEIMTMFLAGHETTATALTWTFYLLATHTDVRARLQRELDAVLAGRSPGVEDVPALSYARMTLAESMRLYPPVWTLTRRATEQVEIGGVRLPAGAVVGMSQFVMHRDPRYFHDPERFDPLRWSDGEPEKRPKYSYFPFGGGPRHCIGEALAWMEMTLLLARLSQDWEAAVSPHFKLRLQPLITLRPLGGMPMTLQRRTPPGNSRHGAQA